MIPAPEYVVRAFIADLKSQQCKLSLPIREINPNDRYIVKASDTLINSLERLLSTWEYDDTRVIADTTYVGDVGGSVRLVMFSSSLQEWIDVGANLPTNKPFKWFKINI